MKPIRTICLPLVLLAVTATIVAAQAVETDAEKVLAERTALAENFRAALRTGDHSAAMEAAEAIARRENRLITILQDVSAATDQVAILQNHLDTTLSWLTANCATEEEWRKAIGLFIDLCGESHHRVTNARRGLAEAKRLSELSPAEMEQLIEAEERAKRITPLLESRRYEEAIPIAEHAVRVFTAHLGEENRRTLWRLDDLAALYEWNGDLERAEHLLRQCLEIRNKALGENHPEMASSLSKLGLLYRSMGAPAKAEPLLQQALAVQELVFGEEDSITAAGLNNLALVYQDMGEFGRAEPLLLESLAINKKVLGEEHEITISQLNNLALLYKSMGDMERAEPLHQEALTLARKSQDVHESIVEVLIQRWNSAARLPTEDRQSQSALGDP